MSRLKRISEYLTVSFFLFPAPSSLLGLLAGLIIRREKRLMLKQQYAGRLAGVSVRATDLLADLLFRSKAHKPTHHKWRLLLAIILLQAALVMALALAALLFARPSLLGLTSTVGGVAAGLSLVHGISLLLCAYFVSRVRRQK